ncbi:MAG: hypothetical protein OHK0017_05390 [Patescibacteria group bacterium]
MRTFIDRIKLAYPVTTLFLSFIAGILIQFTLVLYINLTGAEVTESLLESWKNLVFIGNILLLLLFLASSCLIVLKLTSKSVNTAKKSK